MKLRIRGNTIRFRLTQKEVDQLSHGEPVAETTVFSPLESLEYTLSPWKLEVIKASFDQGKVEVRIPEMLIRKWAETDQVGMEFSQENETGSPLSVLIEKDFACLKPREGEDESDHFPNPMTPGVKC